MEGNIVNWNDVWKNQMMQNVGSNPANDYASLWKDRLNAKVFWEITMQNDMCRIERTLDSLPLKANSKVLDIGCGPGSLSLLISGKVSHVTAVEPSKEMMGILQENIKKNEIDNIDCVNKRWEDIDVQTDLQGPYDVVFASYSLGMMDMKDAIRKMMSCSSDYVYLFWIAGPNLWDIYCPNIWSSLHHKEYHPMPKFNVLYNILYQMGIYPNVSVSKLNYVNRFSSFDEAVNYCMPIYRISNSEQEEQLRDYLQKVLKKDDKSFFLEAKTNHVEVWWQNNAL
ncbi:class I SAM-dependent methyltransferase [Methanolobus vulcani]|uniref:Class I SAM-dependent methyltransferase n=1 Tax=Methanolobus vulcani TaxID=38026 RepID=A0A7Z8P269_9EURY|nr:class I SAM-dependent methyltransferase [Methanolobus vulcani]TQD25917.1 class I SAM-dependent methyltransferase [Methanolobus vulcani]